MVKFNKIYAHIRHFKPGRTKQFIHLKHVEISLEIINPAFFKKMTGITFFY
jgi:hypothetical protein